MRDRSRSRGDGGRSRSRATASALILGLSLLGPPSAGAGGAVVIRVRDADGRPSPNAGVVARCPGGGEWRARTDAEGFAVIADVPPCALSVSAGEPGGAERVVLDRFESRVDATPRGELARDLPAAPALWSFLETAEPAAILDRIDGAGLHLGEPGRFSMRGTSWTENTVLLDGFDVTDPLRGGTPLPHPDRDVLERIEVVSGLAPVEQAGPGVALSLVTLTPARSWQGGLEAGASASRLQAAELAGGPPSIARLGSLVDASAVGSGPLGDRLYVLLSARFGRVQRYEGDDPHPLEARHLSGNGEVVFRPNDRDAWRLLSSAQAVRRPFAGRALFFGDPPGERVDVLGGQLRFAHAGTRATVSAFAGLWTGLFEPQTAGHEGGRPVERLQAGPVPELVFPDRSRRSILAAGVSLALGASRLGGLWHAPRGGTTLGRASAVEGGGGRLEVPETVGAWPAHVWEYSWTGSDSHRHVRDFAAWAADRVVYRDRLLVEAGVRLDASAGAAEGAGQDVSWTTVSPRVSARFRLTGSGRVTFFGGYADYRHRLLLAPLAFGDPRGPHAAVYRWGDADHDGRFQPAERGPLVARVGPGAPDGSLATIDPGLRPPRTREVVAGLEMSPGHGWSVRLFGIDRRERDLVESVDVGAPASAYEVRYIPDPAGDILGPQDDQLLPVYDRKPATFGQDRYLLTNPAGHGGRHQGLELIVEKTLGARLALLAGGTASRTETAGANRGFRVTENDQGLLGERFDDPNADTHASGRSFFDRAFTLKAAASYRGPRDWRLSVAARYQDGQPFGRLVVVEDLAQGPEAVPATPRGQIMGSGTKDEAGRYVVPSGHRFTYTLTVDARVEKGFRLGPRRLALRAEAFNLLSTRNEVEEDPLWGPSFRKPTALQPPRAFRLGLRFDF